MSNVITYRNADDSLYFNVAKVCLCRYSHVINLIPIWNAFMKLLFAAVALLAYKAVNLWFRAFSALPQCSILSIIYCCSFCVVGMFIVFGRTWWRTTCSVSDWKTEIPRQFTCPIIILTMSNLAWLTQGQYFFASKWWLDILPLKMTKWFPITYFQNTSEHASSTSVSLFENEKNIAFAVRNLRLRSACCESK